MNWILNLPKDITNQIFGYLLRYELFTFASASKQLWKIVEKYYDLRYFIVPMTVEINDLGKFLRIVIEIDSRFANLQFDLRKNKYNIRKRLKVKLKFCQFFNLYCRDRIMLPTFHPIVDQLIYEMQLLPAKNETFRGLGIE